ncbi:hypothetical protein FKP32DRAFT_168830, partial [Trametes sanguinea]
ASQAPASPTSLPFVSVPPPPPRLNTLRLALRRIPLAFSRTITNAPATQPPIAQMSGRYIVVFKDHVPQSEIDKYVNEVNANGGSVAQRYDSVLKSPTASSRRSNRRRSPNMHASTGGKPLFCTRMNWPARGARTLI